MHWNEYDYISNFMKMDLYIVDGSSYIFRAYYAIRPLRTSTGIPTNAIIGFTKMLRRLISEFKPNFMAVVFDSKEKTFRHHLYPDYKANRDTPPEDLLPQIPYIHRITEAHNIPVFLLPGYEADDIIATIANREKDNFNIFIISGDKDLMQLVGPETRMFDPMREKLYDPIAVKEKMGVNPEHIRDYLAIMGDSSDNVPGVSGIGAKGAAELINAHGNLENIYENLDKIAGSKKQKLIDSKDMAFLSKKLVTLDKNVPFKYSGNDLAFKEPDQQQLTDLFQKLEFRSLLKEFPPPVSIQEKSETPSRYQSILSHEDFENLLRELKSHKSFALDTETTSLEPRKADLVGLSFAFREHEAFYIPVGHSYLNAPKQLDLHHVLKKLKPIFEDRSIGKIGHNIKYDMVVLKNYGVEINNVFFDTMLASYVLNPEIESHSLDHLSKVHLGHNTIKYKDVTGTGKSARSFSEVELPLATDYAAEDSDCTLRLYNIFLKHLDGHPSSRVFFDIEMPLISSLASMESTGVCIDTNFLKSLSKQFDQELAVLIKDIHRIAGESFNINSTKQLSHILYQKLGIQPISKIKTGFSTRSEVLKKLSHRHEIASKLLEYREFSKLKNTYIDALPELVLSRTNRIHTSYNQTVTTTGRLSSSKPNLQNIPIRTPRGEQIRKAFIAPSDEYFLVGADYNQIELRIMAHMADDRALTEDFRNHRDVHSQTAIRVFNLSEETLTPEFRRRAKAINFGLIYGMGPFALSENLSISVKEAKALIDIYFTKHSGVKAYMEKTIAFVHEHGYVETLFGRRRYFNGINDRNQMVQKNNERAAINAPIQGTSADIIKIAMINIFKKLKDVDAKMILQVHDELVFEVHRREVEHLNVMIKNEMENVIKLNVPLLVDVATGNNWLETHKEVLL